jgi:type IV pilus assembly protein PilX
MRKPHRLGRDTQTGAVLFVALILLLVLSLLAVAAARMQTVEERIARNENNRQVGAAAAEATLR